MEEGSEAAPDEGRALRIANLAVWSIAAALLTLIGISLIPFTLGRILLPVAPALALAANLWLPRQMLAGTGWGWAKYLPALLWVVISVAGSMVTGDGDLLIPGSGYSSAVGVAYLGFGALGAVLGVAFAGTDLGAMRRSMRRVQDRPGQSRADT